MQQFVSGELLEAVEDTDLIVLVYKRDSAKRSDVIQRRKNPFRNPINGIDSTEPANVVLFGRYSHEPNFAGTVVWQYEARVNSTVGTVAFKVTRAFAAA
jgi:hypothetical protein